MSKMTRETFKAIAVTAPCKEDYLKKCAMLPNAENVYSVYLLNRRRFWAIVTSANLAIFCTENNNFLMDPKNLTNGKGRKCLKRAYKKANKLYKK